jgi:hypothetical protein
VVAQGGIFRFDDGRTCPDLLTGVYEYPGFVLEITANLGNSRRSMAPAIMGSEGTLTLTNRGVLVTFEPTPDRVAWYGLNGWTKAARARHLESLGLEEGKVPAPPPPKQPQEFTVERGLEHWEYFIESIREGKPSRENAEDGHCAAGAAHLANMAYRRGRKLRWSPDTGKVTEA